MNDWGWKVMKQGASTSSTDLRDLLANSSFNMFKYHLDTTSSMTINAGDTTKTITIPHNLGYVPAFLTYQGDSDYVKLLPNRKTPAFTGIDEHWYSYADSTNIYIKWDSKNPYNQSIFYVNDGYTNNGTNSLIEAGDINGSSLDCGYRFIGVNISKNASIYSASVEFRVDGRGQSGTDVKIKTWGIDEDNVGSFGNDLGKTKTTAEVSQNVAAGYGSFFGINVKSIVEEITSRNGWSPGNAMGFYTFNDSSPTGAYVADQLSTSYDTYLKVILTGSVNYSFRVVVFKDKITD